MAASGDNREFDASGRGGASEMARLRAAMAAVDAADSERYDPPADLWDRIAAMVDAAGSPGSSGLVVEYVIDAADVVCSTGGAWAGFARDNDAAELSGLSEGNTLWSYFDAEDIRDLWRAVVARVRIEQVEATVPLRCDAPDTRRWFEMTITPGPSGSVAFRSALVFEESRPTVAFLDPHMERDTAAPAIALCSWCGLADSGAAWVSIEELVTERRLFEQPVVPPIAYGICPSCRNAMSAELLVSTQDQGPLD